MDTVKFIAKIHVWREKKQNKTYKRYIIIIPSPVRDLIDKDKQYKITLEPLE